MAGAVHRWEKRVLDFVDVFKRPEAPDVIQIFDSEIAGTIRPGGRQWTRGAQTNVINLTHHCKRSTRNGITVKMTGGNDVIARE
jgi:hypothetical protein